MICSCAVACSQLQLRLQLPANICASCLEIMLHTLGSPRSMTNRSSELEVDTLFPRRRRRDRWRRHHALQDFVVASWPNRLAANVITLQEQPDHKLQQRQARETAICPIREELYFDDLIRR